MKFRTIDPSRRPNRWLICPPGYANRAPDEVPPVFGVPVGALRETWRDFIRRQPRIQLRRDEPEGMGLVQRSAVLRFADDIDVAYIALGQQRSTIALFSRSRIGYSDLGVNRRRLQAWLAALSTELHVEKAGQNSV